MVPHKKAHPILLQQQSHMQAGMYVSKQSRKQAIRHMLHKATITTQTIVLDDNCLRGASYWCHHYLHCLSLPLEFLFCTTIVAWSQKVNINAISKVFEVVQSHSQSEKSYHLVWFCWKCYFCNETKNARTEAQLAGLMLLDSNSVYVLMYGLCLKNCAAFIMLRRIYSLFNLMLALNIVFLFKKLEF